MKPTTLSSIYFKLKVDRFRVRDVTTLRDYLCTNAILHPGSAYPRFLAAVCCDDGVYSRREAEIPCYVLLSTEKEIAQMKAFTKDLLVNDVLATYRRVQL